MYRIVKKKPLSELVELMVVEAPNVARHCEPGQFVIVGAEDGGERIPLTIQDFDREKNTVNIIYQVVGYSTAKLRERQEGESLPFFLGPLGVPAHYSVENPKKIIGIGGGLGIAPLYPQMRKFKEDGVSVDVILGGRSANLVILQEEFEKLTGNVFYATNDGSLGVQGLVTDLLKERLAQDNYDFVLAIGPVVMMKAVMDVTRPLNVPTGVSLNPLMIDGTGMCGGCRVTIGGETKFACVDGPDFDGYKVDFDEIMRRQSFYRDEEHACRLKVNI